MLRLRDALDELPDAVFVDVLESDDAYRLVVDLPGVTADTLDVTLDGRLLRIQARRDKGGVDGSYVREDRSLFLDADLPLPPDASGEGATGSIDRGVLEVTLPKRDEVTGTAIEIEDA